MEQRFDTRNYSVQDFENWNNNGELELSPKFQRRNVWSDKARSYLIDTIIRGKPIPKIYMRQDINPTTRRTRREVVDGQQRLRSILGFLKDAFPILKAHNPEYANLRFSELDDDVKTDILQYELSVDLLQNVPDKEIYDIFARLNAYSIVLNAQEKRNGNYFGEFKTIVYVLSNEYLELWKTIFSPEIILRMAEAEFTSELLIAIIVGIRAKEAGFIDKFYAQHDEIFPNPEFVNPDLPQREEIENRFRKVMDTVGELINGAAPRSKRREARFIYPLFCAIYHMQYGLPEVNWKRVLVKPEDYPRITTALEHIDEIFEKVKRGNQEAREHQRRLESQQFSQVEDQTEPSEDYENGDDFDYLDAEAGEAENHREATLSGIVEGFDPLYLLSPEERQFRQAYDVRWVHAANRRLQTEYICNLMVRALEN